LPIGGSPDMTIELVEIAVGLNAKLVVRLSVHELNIEIIRS
jgi:hypothetical protein